MDIGLYRDEEQFFTFESAFLDNYPEDSTSLDGIHSLVKNDFFDCFDGINPSANELFDWNVENEQELNGDIAVIPMTGNSCEVINSLSISPPVKEDFQKSMGFHNWQTLTNSPEFSAEEENILKQKNDNSSLQEVLDLPDLTDSKFNITTYVCGETEQKVAVKSQPARKIKAAVKKIDLQAQKYIVEDGINNEDDDVDIETVSEGSPILEAGDLNSLLEQFESTNMSILPQNILENSASSEFNIPDIKIEPPDPCIEIDDEDCVSLKELGKNTVELEMTDAGMDYLKKQQKFLAEQTKTKEKFILVKKRDCEGSNSKGETSPKKRDLKSHLKPPIKPPKNPLPTTPQKCVSNSTASLEPASKQQILNSLPQELINRIKESGKRKPITVIPPIPTNNKKRNRLQDDMSKKIVKLGNSDTVNLDHSYCSSPSQNSKKDSGFESSEDDDKEKRDKTVISQQPVVKNADGKLMVSLLKVNTIHNVEVSNNQKKKLNLEEYKKRRKGFITPNSSSSQNCSPNASSCSSPLYEDEQLKLLKHQEKLRRMAEEVLNAAPKSDKKSEGASNTVLPLFVNAVPSPAVTPRPPASDITSPLSQPNNSYSNIIQPMTPPLILCASPLSTSVSPTSVSNVVPLPVPPPSVSNIPPPSVHVLMSPSPCEPAAVVEKLPPSNIETKILVSFGVNTDFKVSKNKDPMFTVEKLEEIKPLLKKASSKISNNSLITSLIENIPKVINQNDGSRKSCKVKVGEINYEHGENKQVLHLEKDRVRVETVSVSIQTNISLIEQSRRGRVRRRLSSSGSSSSGCKSPPNNRRSRKSSDSSPTSSRSSRCSRSCSSSRSSNYSSRVSGYSRSRSRSPRYTQRRRSVDKDHINAVEERRIIYVGRITNATTKEDLRRKFHKFGTINNISLHFRDHGYSDLENYGFVTFKYKEDAHEAYEHGNDDPSHPYFKISFGGRREFCKTSYSDLDNVRDDEYFLPKASENSFDALLREAQEKLRKRKA